MESTRGGKVTKRKFVFEFKDESAKSTGDKNDTIRFEHSGDETISLQVIDGATYLFANRAGMVTLAKTLLKLGLSEYKSGFHVHLRENFDADAPEILCIAI
jgi:hypothetical protein